MKWTDPLAGPVIAGETAGAEVGVDGGVRAGAAVVAEDGVDGALHGDEAGTRPEGVKGAGAFVGGPGVAGGVDDQGRDVVGDPGRGFTGSRPEGAGTDVVRQGRGERVF